MPCFQREAGGLLFDAEAHHHDSVDGKSASERADGVLMSFEIGCWRCWVSIFMDWKSIDQTLGKNG